MAVDGQRALVRHRLGHHRPAAALRDQVFGGGVAAKADALEAEARAEKAEAEAERERASGRRWYALFEECHAGWRHERAARGMDRQVIAAMPGSPAIQWPALEPVPDRQAMIARSEDALHHGAAE